MGSCEFESFARGKTAKEAFTKAREEAQYESGHGGYTGTIAEKNGFVMVGLVAATTKEAYALHNELMEKEDSRIQDKWGPAGCIEIKSVDGAADGFLFFGYASS